MSEDSKEYNQLTGEIAVAWKYTSFLRLIGSLVHCDVGIWYLHVSLQAGVFSLPSPPVINTSTNNHISPQYKQPYISSVQTAIALIGQCKILKYYLYLIISYMTMRRQLLIIMTATQSRQLSMGIFSSCIQIR